MSDFTVNNLKYHFNYGKYNMRHIITIYKTYGPAKIWGKTLLSWQMVNSKQQATNCAINVDNVAANGELTVQFRLLRNRNKFATININMYVCCVH